MDISIVNGIRVITPDEGLWLYKEVDRIISDKVFLGVGDMEAGWTEITEERKNELETLWETESNPENMATDKDYISALESLGVDFNG